MRAIASGVVIAGALALTAGVAQAHPHIWVDAKARIVFNEAGELTAIYNTWTFDEAFSVWQTQGLDTNGDGITSSEEMQELADENLKGLAEYGFYTLAGEGDASLPLASLDDGRFEFKDNRSTLTFGVEPQGPYRIKGKFDIAIADPEYYVAINFANLSDVTLENAPAGCTLGMEPPRELSPDVQERLGQLAADILTLPPDLEAAVRGAQGAIVIDCSKAAAVAPRARHRARGGDEGRGGQARYAVRRAAAGAGLQDLAHRAARLAGSGAGAVPQGADGGARQAQVRLDRILGPGRTELPLRHIPCCRARAWQGGDRELHAGQRAAGGARHRAELRLRSVAGGSGDGSGRDRRSHPAALDKRDGPRGCLDRAWRLWADGSARAVAGGTEAVRLRPRASRAGPASAGPCEAARRGVAACAAERAAGVPVPAGRGGSRGRKGRL